jgi:hypothetical protein
MKISLLSDLHLSVCPLEPPRVDADLFVVAGDLHRPPGAIEWSKRLAGPALFVAGNHEFYGGSIAGTYRSLRQAAHGSNVSVLEQDAFVFQGVRFLGCTLWSDYRLFDSPEQAAEGLAQARTQVRDFSRIRVSDDCDELFSPAVSRLLFDTSVDWLERQFAQAHDGPTVVVTHFAPSRGSIGPRFAGSPLNACFVSDLDERIRRWQPALWLHGHVHERFDYRVGITRVVTNPRGYARDGRPENADFDPWRVIEVG